MADLFDRLFPTDGSENIPVAGFFGAMVDYATGNITRTSIINYWSLDSEAQTDLNAMCDDIDAMNASQKVQFGLELHSVLAVAELGLRYTDKSSFKTRLGI